MIVDPYSHVVSDLVYSPGNVSGPGGNEGNDNFSQALDGCDCTTDCATACQHLVKYGRNYEMGLILKTSLNQPIFECNARCSCEPSRCANRIVQFGPNQNLEIITTEAKGFGVIAKRKLRSGEFVCEYAGEVIGPQAARNRMKLQEEKNQSNYIMVLREMCAEDRVEKTIIDPTIIGNIGRYLNHSCDPNLVMVPVRTSSMVPHLALFTNRDVMQGEELCFDYGDPERGVRKKILATDADQPQSSSATTTTTTSTTNTTNTTNTAKQPENNNHMSSLGGEEAEKKGERKEGGVESVAAAPQQRTPCLCRAKTCRKFLPFVEHLFS